MLKRALLLGAAALVGTVNAGACAGASGGLTIASGGSPGCACPSGFEDESTCTTVISACSAIPATTNTTFDVGGMAVTTVDMSGTDSLVTLTLQIPMSATRNYTSLQMSGPAITGLPGAGCTQAAFYNFTLGTVGNSACLDSWILTVPFQTLRGCGFNVSSLDGPTDNVQTYNGNFRVGFVETVTVGTGSFAQNLPRTASIDFPIKVNFQSEFTFNMTVSNVTVYGTELVDWAITNQNIPKDGSNPTALLAYIIQYPYAIIDWVSNLAESGAASNIPGTVQAFSAANSTLACSLSDYSASDNATAATCKKDGIYVTFDPIGTDAASCKFSDYIYTLSFNVKCVQGLPATDCPLNQTNTYTAAFTVNSENFCTDLAANNTINNVITINNFTGVAPTNNWAAQTAWRELDDAYFQMGFSGLPLSACQLSGLDTQFGPSDITGVAWQTIVAKDNSNTAITGVSLPGFNDNNALVATLGLDSSGTRYRFKVQVSQTLLGSAPAPQIPLIRGRDYFLKLRATVDVKYDRGFTGLRRRRQASSTAESGSGSIESPTQSVGAADETAAAPTSSASRVAPVVAMALAVISAVVLA